MHYLTLIMGCFLLGIQLLSTSVYAQNTTTSAASTTTVKPVGNMYMHQAHGELMLAAWMVVMTLSILIARYYRMAWPNTKIMGKPVWFQLHYILNILGITLTGISIVLIFSTVRGISTFKPYRPTFTKAHPYMGIAVTVLLFVNALMAIFRGDPSDKWRPVFNWVHRITGVVCYILAIVTIFSGLNMASFIPQWNLWVMLGWVFFMMVLVIILEIQTCYPIGGSAKSSIYNTIPDGLTGNEDKEKSADPHENDSLLHPKIAVKETDNKVKYILLALWVVVTLVFYGVLFWGILVPGSWTGI